MEKEDLKYAISRFDAYYKHIDSKGRFLLGFNTFLIGGVILAVSSILEDSYGWYKVVLSSLLFIEIILTLISIGYVIVALMPYTKGESVEKKKYKSLFFYGSVANMTETTFCKKIKKYSQVDVLKDLSKQMFLLSKGLNHKFQTLKIAFRFNGVAVVVLFVILIMVVVNAL
jgi:hypothetical protein